VLVAHRQITESRQDNVVVEAHRVAPQAVVLRCQLGRRHTAIEPAQCYGNLVS
jgi:hypothetical protein